MRKWLSTQHLARFSIRRPWLIVGIWAALVFAGGFLASGVGDVLTNEFALENDADSVQADDLLEERLRGPDQPREFVVVTAENATVDDPQYESFVGGLLADIRGLDHVDHAASFFETQNEDLVSADRHTTLLPVNLAGDEWTEPRTTPRPLVDAVEERNSQGGDSRS